ncbi:TPA: hypothetical protein ACX6QL_003458 [Photobacterium damselae]
MTYGISVKDVLGNESILDYQPFNFVRRYHVIPGAKNKSVYVPGVNGALKVVPIETGGSIASLVVDQHTFTYSTMGESGGGYLVCFASRG